MPVTPDRRIRCALITGAARGIGRAVAPALAEAGANVAVDAKAGMKGPTRGYAARLVKEGITAHAVALGWKT
jgi:NAD(P)-dependent dehydrogenase (short-subunit alcohol dehydrogenase family)